MQICRSLAGYSYGQADEVRRAMGKKKMDVMALHRNYFINGKVNDNGEVEIEGASGAACQGNGRAAFRPNVRFRPICVQQKPRRGLRLRILSDGLLQALSSRGVSCGSAEQPHNQHRRHKKIYRLRKGEQHRFSASGHQQVGSELHRGKRENTFRACRQSKISAPAAWKKSLRKEKPTEIS